MSDATPRVPMLPLARWLIAAVFALLTLLQLGTILWLIWGEPVQVPWQDELFHYRFFMRAGAGTATWADYWQPLGGVHRTVFPRLLYVLAIDATAWDRRVWLTINPLLIAGTVAALVAVARQTTGSRHLAGFLVAPIAALLFALSQYSQWLQPFGLQFALVLFCGAVALWALTARPRGWPQLALALGATWVASWSGLHGLALWALLLPLVLLAGWRKALVWLACAVAVIGTYAVDLPRQGVQQLAPGELIAFVLTNLGAPLGALQNPATRAQFWNHTEVHLDQRWALWIGAASVLLLAANLLAAWRAGRVGRANLERYLPWCCLALFAVACAALTGLGRASTAASSALTARYHSFALLWWIALVVIGAQVAATYWPWQRAVRFGWPQALVAGNLVALGVGTLLFAQVNMVSGLLLRDLHGQLRRAETCARDLASAPDDCLVLLHPVPAVARLRLAGLAQERLALFRDGALPMGSGKLASSAVVPDPNRLGALPFGGLYTLDGQPGPLAYFDGSPPPPHFPFGKPLQFSGWAVDVIAIPPGPASGVFLAIDGRQAVWLPTTIMRPEVAARFDAGLAYPGFALELPAGALAPGRHTLRLTVVTRDGASAYQPSPVLVFFVDGAAP